MPFPGRRAVQGTAFRWLYFDGDSFRVFRDERTYTDHVADNIDAPEEVLERMKDYVQGLYESPEEGGSLVDGEFVSAPVEYDDWRIRSVTGPVYEEVAGLQVEIWRLDYQLHTTTPENVLLSGGRYMTEDGWLSAGYPDCDYFFFQLSEDGTRTYLFHRMENDCAPGTELFRSDLINALSELGVVSLSELPGQTLLEMLAIQPAAFLERLVPAVPGRAGPGHRVPGTGPPPRSRIGSAAASATWIPMTKSCRRRRKRPGPSSVPLWTAGRHLAAAS